MTSVLISNGYGRFHLAVAAAELQANDALCALLTGAYPTPRLAALLRLSGLYHQEKIQRLIDRRESVPPSRVVPFAMPEAVSVIGARLGALVRSQRVSEELVRRSLRLYGRQARALVRRFAAEADIYHYRAGFGGVSVSAARQAGMLTICDHSIAHPSVLQYLLDNEGRLPEKPLTPPTNPMWAQILDDIQLADHVLVNSDFVKTTFLSQGWPTEKVHVVYWGIDDRFVATSTELTREVREAHDSLRLIFAGSFTRRKGALTVADAVAELPEKSWRLTVVGDVSSEMMRLRPAFFKDSRVSVLGRLPRGELARLFDMHDCLVFPSLAEGSARVVFEALARGCFVITTRNAGSIVEEGVHGAIVPAGDPQALAGALRNAMEDRTIVTQVGMSNAALVAARYTQRHYGAELLATYRRLLKSGMGGLAW